MKSTNSLNAAMWIMVLCNIGIIGGAGYLLGAGMLAVSDPPRSEVTSQGEMDIEYTPTIPLEPEAEVPARFTYEYVGTLNCGNIYILRNKDTNQQFLCVRSDTGNYSVCPMSQLPYCETPKPKPIPRPPYLYEPYIREPKAKEGDDEAGTVKGFRSKQDRGT